MKKYRLLILIIILNIFLITINLFYRKINFQFIEVLLFVTLIILIIIVISAIGARITSVIFSHKYPSFKTHFIFFNILFSTLLVSFNVHSFIKNYLYNKYKANIDFNKYYTKQGGFLDTCFMMVEADLLEKGIKPNDYKIQGISWDMALSTMPMDTSDKFYNFELTFIDYSKKEAIMKNAKYLINFKKEIKELSSNDSTKNNQEKNTLIILPE